ncbi:MAG: hypothetical protein GF401_08345 [Chitinivibrionales bacterium]|nr:hypothetical protein [Chitinivibrionales bacterium]
MPEHSFKNQEISMSPVWLKKAVLSLGGKPELKKIIESSKNVRIAQETIFKEIIKQGKNTRFGRDHGFSSLRTIDDYRKAVPFRSYNGLAPYIDRMQQGENDVLFPGKPILYNTTSGTTDKPKLIPVSKYEFDRVLKSLSRAWLYKCIHDNPSIWNGANLSLVGSPVEGTVADGAPCGSISGLTYKNIPGILKSLYSVPYPIMTIEDYMKKYYGLLRFALAKNITYIISANPSSLLKIHQVVMDNYTDLVKDIRDGTLRDDVVESIGPDDREEALLGLAPMPARAAELEQILKEHGDNLRPGHYWPNLACVNTWTQGNCSLVIPKLDGYYPESTVIREFGYFASEARAVTLENDWESSLLPCAAYHFEFIPEDERDTLHPSVLNAWEVEKGKRYFITFSTLSGLYRYDINDVVEITGFYNQAPLFKFMYKGQGITSLTGEKLSEEQIIMATKRVSKDLAMPVEFFTMICDENRMIYTLYAEFAASPTPENKNRFIGAVDRVLTEINPEWKTKRGSERLSLPELNVLPKNSYDLLKEKLRVKNMVRESQYKVSYLRREPLFASLFQEMAS